MALPKAQIIKEIMHRNGYTKNQATEAVEILLENKKTLASGGRGPDQWIRQVLCTGKART